MQEPRLYQEIIRNQLKAKRNLLLKRFYANPSDTHLAIEIRSIDDRVAEITWQMMENKKSNAAA